MYRSVAGFVCSLLSFQNLYFDVLQAVVVAFTVAVAVTFVTP